MKDIIIIIYLLILNITHQERNISTNTSYNDTFESSPIYTLNDNNFDKVIKGGIYNPYLILFTLKRCKKCENYLKIFEKILNNITNTTIKLCKINMSSSTWTTMRFNITSLPKVVYIKDRHMAYMNEQYNYDNIMEFINKALHNKTNYYRLPKALSYYDIYLMIMKGINQLAEKKAMEYGIPWNYYFTVILVFFIMILITIINRKLFFCCFGGCFKQKNDKHNDCNSHKCSHCGYNKKLKPNTNNHNKYD